MATRIISALVLVVLVTAVFLPAVAEGTYRIAAVVVSYETSSFGDLEIEVVDAEGEVWAYYADEAHVGDLVVLTVFDFGDHGFEDDEIIDVATVAHLNAKEMAQWLAH